MDCDVGQTKSINEWVSKYGFNVVKTAYFVEASSDPYARIGGKCWITGVSASGGFDIQHENTVYIAGIGHVNKSSVSGTTEFTLCEQSSSCNIM